MQSLTPNFLSQPAEGQDQHVGTSWTFGNASVRTHLRCGTHSQLQHITVQLSDLIVASPASPCLHVPEGRIVTNPGVRGLHHWCKRVIFHELLRVGHQTVGHFGNFHAVPVQLGVQEGDLMGGREGREMRRLNKGTAHQSVSDCDGWERKDGGNDVQKIMLWLWFTSFWTSSLVGFLVGWELMWTGLGWLWPSSGTP